MKRSKLSRLVTLLSFHPFLIHVSAVADEDPSYDDDFLRSYALASNEEKDCRDAPETFVNCTAAREKGLCDLKNANTDLILEVPEMCQVTCGTCPKPPTKTSLWVDYECFDHAQDITVHFTNIDPEPDDFVALYPGYLDLETRENTDQMDMWLFSCGTIQEHCRTASGAVVFGNRGISPTEKWYYFPLEPGTYKVALLRYNGTLILESEPFTVKAEDHSCAWECRDAVFADSECYEKQDSIHVTFENCAARNEDRIAIYSHTVEEDEPLLWLDTCHSHDCMGDAKNDFVTFGSTAQRHLLQGKEDWPLPAGDYVAALVRLGGQGPHGRKVVQSQPFQVLKDGEYCEIEEEEL